MKIISRGLHGIMDYLAGVFLITSPWLLHFANGSSAQNIPVIIGGSIIVYSIFTNYETGVLKLLSFNFHLLLDFVAGAMLVFSPFIFQFSEVVLWPHMITGLFLIGTTLTTDTHAETGERGRRFVRQPPGQKS